MSATSTAEQFLSALAHTPVSEIMTKDVKTVYEGWSIRRLSQFFLKHNISGAPVVAADDELVGVVTQSDVLRFDSQKPDKETIEKVVERYCGPTQRELDQSELNVIQGKALDYMTVNSIMTGMVITVDIEDTLEKAYQLIVDNNIHRLFVIDKGILVGVVTAMDILKSLNR